MTRLVTLSRHEGTTGELVTFGPLGGTCKNGALEKVRDRGGATLILFFFWGGGGAPLVPQCWGGGAQDTFFLPTLYNFENIGGGGARAPQPPPYSAVPKSINSKLIHETLYCHWDGVQAAYCVHGLTIRCGICMATTQSLV